MDLKDRFKKGLIDMLLLKVLSEHDCYGYQITQILKRVSNDSIVVREPSMYPILYRLQGRGLITSYTQKGRGHMERVYYHIEDSGREELKQLSDAYQEVQRGVEAVMEYTEAAVGFEKAR